MTESRFAEAEAGADRAADAKVKPLPSGHRLGEFELDSVLGVGGFGIVYRAFDRTLQRTVAVKEYMPTMLARRAGDYTVGVRASRYAHAFEAGRTAFLNEARLLAQFDHPGLLKVLHFWESHGTAYMVMPFYEGQTLAQRKRRVKHMSEPELLDLFGPLLGALHTLHRAQCFHRDISLDNILVQPGGQPVLLDFGAARKLIGDLVDETAMILKPGYAPIEQYTDDPAFKQGAWTDLYALGAVAYALITGDLPPAAVVRSIQDQYRPLAGRQWADDGPHYSERLLTAIDAALALRIEDRPASVPAFAQRLGLRETMPGVFVTLDRAASSPFPVETEPAWADADASVAVESEPGATALEPVHDEVDAASPTTSTGDVHADGTQNATAPTELDVTAATDRNDRRSSSLWGALSVRRYAVRALALLVIATGGVTLLRLAMRPSGQTLPAPGAPTTAQLAVPQPLPAPPHDPPTATAPPPAAVPGVQQNVSRTTSAAVQTAASSAMAARAPEASPQASAGEMPRTTSAASAALAALAKGASNPASIAMQAPAAHDEATSAANEPNAPQAAGPITAARSKALRPVLVRLYVFPWGEVYVNGVRRGISPPFRAMSLTPGTYRIEVRNGTLPPLVRTVTLDAGESPVEIRYSFE
ncbi:MAG: serine/threonine protein kinase [Paraburkholderia sp.]|nr:MAG: serine/threonine protein kinase [Paraburkholderia sp.]